MGASFSKVAWIPAGIVLALWGCLPTCGFTQDSEQVETEQVVAPFYGRIVDPDGNPVADAKLVLRGPGYLSTESDDQGRFWFLDANQVGEYRLEIKSTRWVGLTDYRKMPRISIDPDQPQEQNFTLERACRIELTVVDEEQQPVRASVYYRPIARDLFRNAESTKTNGEGVSLIGGLAPSKGKYLIAIHSNEHSPARIIASVDDPEAIVKHKIVLSPGKSIRGRVLCSDGEPPAGWHVYALPTWWKLGVFPGNVKIEEDGSFELPHVGDDRYNISVSIPLGDGMSTSRYVLTDALLNEMEQPLQVTLDYPSPKSMNYLTGTIRWIGKPLQSGIRISGYSAELKHHTSHHIKAGETDFKIGPMPSSVYRIRAEHPELEVINLRKIKNLNDLDHVRVPNEKPLQLVLRVRGKSHVQGVVVDAETQEPISRFRYRVAKLRTLSGPNYVQDDNWKLGKDADGSFRTDVVGPGVYKVSVVADGYAIHTSRQVNTDEEPDEVLRIKLARGVALSGQVTDGDGRPVSGATVRALSLASGAMPRVLERFVTSEGAVETEKDGRFLLTGLRPGVETIRVDHPDFAFKVVQNVSVQSENEPLSIELSPGATLRGRVFDASGKPQGHEVLTFQDDYAYGGGDREAGKYGEATTDENGWYEVKHLPETVVYVSRVEEWNSSGVVRHAIHVEDGQVHRLDLGGTSKLSAQFFVNEQPLENTRVQLGGPDSTFGAMKMFASTDDAGRFVFFGTPPGHWNLYRALDERGSEWAKVRELDVAAGQSLDLGQIRQQMGTLTVECKTSAGALPENLHLDLRRYNPRYLYGRSAAILKPRRSPDDPFVFQNVTPGDYEIACSGVEGLQILQRVQVSEANIDSTIPFHIPLGKGKLTLEVKDDSGEPITSTLMLWSEDGRLVSYLGPGQGQEQAGRYTAAGLPAGNYKLRRGSLRNTDVIATFEVLEEQENRIAVEVPKTQVSAKGESVVNITDEQGVFVPCQLKFQEDAGAAIEWYQTIASMHLVGPAGEYTLQIDHPGYEPLEQKIELRRTNSSDPEKKTIQVRLRRAAENPGLEETP